MVHHAERRISALSSPDLIVKQQSSSFNDASMVAQIKVVGYNPKIGTNKKSITLTQSASDNKQQIIIFGQVV